MFTASRRIRSERTSHNTRAIVLIVLALLFANASALFGLTASAHAGGFPDALRYAPLTWERKAPMPQATPSVTETAAAETVEPPVPVTREKLDPVRTGATPRQFSEIRTTGFVASAGRHHRYLLIGFMTVALGIMAGVSIAMFRGLAREISENERKRNRF
jgi:hypothetical protein